MLIFNLFERPSEQITFLDTNQYYNDLPKIGIINIYSLPFCHLFLWLFISLAVIFLLSMPLSSALLLSQHHTLTTIPPYATSLNALLLSQHNNALKTHFLPEPHSSRLLLFKHNTLTLAFSLRPIWHFSLYFFHITTPCLQKPQQPKTIIFL